ncbi:MAG: transporter substrate-binding domain-containing protein [Microbacteriaceae bacterium]|nr:transporter substrate-binding domain-containing protein [Microbacteriaceae bacterium]
MRLTPMLAGAALAATLLLTGCAADPDGADDERPLPDPTFAAGTTMARIAEAGEVVIGVALDQPLLSRAGADGAPVGFDAEIAELVAHELGIAPDRIRWHELLTREREQALVDGTVDLVVQSYSITESRAERVGFAGPYYEAGQTFLVPEGNPDGVTTDAEGVEESLAGLTVCADHGSSSADRVREYTHNVITVDRLSDCFALVRDGRADLLTSDDILLAGLLTATEGYEIVPGSIGVERYGIGIGHGDDEFREFLDGVLADAFADGRWQEAWDATVGGALPPPMPPTLDR